MLKMLNNIIYVGNDPELHGLRGVAYRAGGHFDPESIEHRAWIFETAGPDGEPIGCYCQMEDLSTTQEEFL